MNQSASRIAHSRKEMRARFSIFLIALFCLLAPLTTWAKSPSVVFNGAQSTLLSETNRVVALAVDGSGNLYLALYGTGTVLKETLKNGIYTESTVATELSAWPGIAVDASQNIYIGDPDHNRVVLETLNADGSYTQSVLFNQATNKLSSPRGVAVDLSGNIYIADAGNNRILAEANNGSGSYTQSVVVNGLTATPQFTNPEAIAVDANGVLYATSTQDAGLILILTPQVAPPPPPPWPCQPFPSCLTPVFKAGHALLKPRAAVIVVAASYTLTTAGSGTVNPDGIAVDPYGNLFVTDSGNGVLLEEVLSGGSYTQNVISTAPANSSYYAVAVDGTGDIYFGNEGGVFLLQTQHVNFGPQAVGSNSSPIAFNFTVQQGTGVSWIGTLTTGVWYQNDEFGWDNSTSTCTQDGSYPSTTNCTVSVDFGPQFSGLRTGAIVFYDWFNQGDPLITVPIYGTGTAPQAALNSAAVAPVPNVNTLEAEAMVTDAAGDLFVLNFENSNGASNSGYVTEYPVIGNGLLARDASGRFLGLSYGPETDVASGFDFPYALALDGAGNLFVCDNNGAIWESQMDPWNNTGFGYGSYGTPQTIAKLAGNWECGGITVDGSGNLFASDWESDTVVEVPYSSLTGYGTPVTIASSIHYPWGLTLDSNGNIFVSSESDNTGNLGTGYVTEIPKNAPGVVGYGTPVTVISGLPSPEGVAVEPNGNLVVLTYVDSNNNDYSGQILEYPATSTGYGAPSTLASGLYYPWSFNMDAAGNLYTLTETFRNDAVQQSKSGRVQLMKPSARAAARIKARKAAKAAKAAVKAEANQGLPVPTPTSNWSGAMEMPRSTVPFLTFADTVKGTTSTDSPQTMTVENIGNADMTFLGVNYPLYFPEAASGSATDCTAATVLAAGQTCTATIDFTPNQEVAGPIEGILMAGTNNLNGNPGLIGAVLYGNETLPTPAAAPVFSVASGQYSTIQTVSISDSTDGAVIYYAIGGSDINPTVKHANASVKSRRDVPYSWLLYTGPITVSSTESIFSYATAVNYGDSTITEADYYINLAPAATPSFSPGTGNYTSAQSVVISDSTDGAAIYYTTDGTTPTTSSNLYSAPIQVSSNQTILAIAAATGYSNSAVASAAYTINLLPAASPSFSPGTGNYAAPQTVTITTTTPSATIYYTIDGSVPRPAVRPSHGQIVRPMGAPNTTILYTGPITVSGSETVEAIAIADGFATSPVATAAYTVNLLPTAAPSFAPGTGNYTAGQTVTLTSSTQGATIYYTTDGTVPTASSAAYTAPISVSNTQTVQAIALAAGFAPSSVSSAAYTITLPVPDFNVGVSAGAMTIAKSGQSATASLNVTPINGFNSAVTFGCSGLPAGASCTFAPPTVTPAGAAASTTLTINYSTVATLYNQGRPMFPGASLAVALCFLGWKKRRSLQMLLLVVVSLIGLTVLSGCGGSSTPAASTSTVTVTATSGSLSHSAVFSLTVN